MADRFVDLQSKLRAVKDDVKRPFRTLVRMMQSNRFLRDAPGVLYQLQFFDQLVAFVLPLSAIRIRIRTFLNLIPGESVCCIASARGVLGLMDVGSLRRYKPLLFAIEVEVGFGQSDPGNCAQFRVDVQQKSDVFLDRDGEWIDGIRCCPLGSDGLFGGEANIMLLHLPRGTSYFNSAGSGSFNPEPR